MPVCNCTPNIELTPETANALVNVDDPGPFYVVTAGRWQGIFANE